MSRGPLPGFRDFYPEQLAERAYITGVWRDIARRFAFVEYDGPPLETLELYTRKSGEEIVGQLYNFTDKGDREVALRPEMTPTLARMVAAKANALRKPVRWFSIPQLFRYERQQKGRLREHFQLNVDILGEPGVTADAELLAVAIEIMRAYGLGPKDVRARVSDRRLLNALLTSAGVKADQLGPVYAAIDKLGREPLEVTREKWLKATGDEDVAIRLEQTILQKDFGKLRATPEMGADVHTAMEEFGKYLELLDALGVREWVDFDLSIVRGLAYYTGTVFELFDASGEFRAICGGGRYDDLLDAIGGVSMPALGFGMGDVVIGELLRARGLMRRNEIGPDYWIASDSEKLLSKVMQVASRVRAAGKSAEYSLRLQTLSRQMKTASSAGAREVIIVAADEAVAVKNLADGSEKRLTLNELIASL
ncbi:MAG: histidine--tRNA ligase [Gemmatimonadaceae bacterium]|nr:histidine--tRNA ligase [Gemmatimonadaceae bacterium]